MEHLIPFVSYVLAVLAGMLIMRVIYSLNISKEEAQEIAKSIVIK